MAEAKKTIQKKAPKAKVVKEAKTPAVLEAPLYNQKGKKVSTISVPESIFGLRKNDTLVHQVAVSLQANRRAGTAHAKDRGEVAGGGKKPWRQKGTGRARHGSTRSPIWVGGGTTHGPRKEKNYHKKINKKMRAKALLTVLSNKFREGHLLFIDTLALPSGKTKEAKEILTAFAGVSGFERLKGKKQNALFVALPTRDTETMRSFQNFSNVTANVIQNMNTLDLLNNTYVAIVNPEQSFSFLESKMK